MASAAGKIAMEVGARQRVRVIGVTLLRSGWHQPPPVRGTLRALGLTRVNRTVYHKNIQPIRGQLLKVPALSLSLPPLPALVAALFRSFPGGGIWRLNRIN
jgi:ribosomal protein L30/L7E